VTDREPQRRADNSMKWLCSQLGAREHYAIPRALMRREMLGCLLTDAWVPPSSFVANVSGGRLADRFHDDLRNTPLIAFNSSLILFEMISRARRLGAWERIIARNRWFQFKVASFLRSHLSTIDYQPILLSYSYSALEPFRIAKSQGWKTVLVQIDPGPEEERIVAEEAARVPALARGWQPAPAEYWASWREECAIADRIVVNSQWSRDGLIRSGVPNGKLLVIPVAYEQLKVGDHELPVGCARSYPNQFTHERPMRVLFLGQANLRKGIARLLEAARLLRGEPVEFSIAGPVHVANATTMSDQARVKWVGPVTRKQAAAKYRAADVFILPTLSDGFAITQLEAQACGLPVITSNFCGGVIENGRNGIILEEPSAAYIAAAIRHCIADPNRLLNFAAASRIASEFTIEALALRLQELESAL
jgi:glycosyltransferase involved in cell wall biosynthesis